MSEDYKLNKSELTKLKRQSILYKQFLPVLKLKQEQMQVELNRVKKNIKAHEDDHLAIKEKLSYFLPCMGDNKSIDLLALIQIINIQTTNKSVAGITVKHLKKIEFKESSLSFFDTPAWVVRLLPILRLYVHTAIFLKFLLAEKKIIQKELQKSIQKVNLFEQVLIPKNNEAIKRIKIALGDEQVASVSRAKLAKNKMVEVFV